MPKIAISYAGSRLASPCFHQLQKKSDKLDAIGDTNFRVQSKWLGDNCEGLSCDFESWVIYSSDDD